MDFSDFVLPKATLLLEGLLHRKDNMEYASAIPEYAK
jgi:hypothetical protein